VSGAERRTLSRSVSLVALIGLAIASALSCGDLTSDLITRSGPADGSCVTAADCPVERSRCDTVSGSCVECLARSECQSGQACSPAGSCISSCDGAPPCPATEPYCAPDSGLCRGCERDTECTGATPRCEIANGRCVECLTIDDCGGEYPLCDTARGRCVECLTAAHCDEANELCSEALGECALPCDVDADCDFDEVCDGLLGFCVDCAEDDDCPVGQACRSSSCVVLP
jgi:hypothetical protein